MRIQLLWIEGTRLENTNFIVSSRFKARAVREGNLITGQQHYFGAAAARLVIEALDAKFIGQYQLASGSALAPGRSDYKEETNA